MTPRLLWVLSFVAGAIDTATFVSVSGLFSAHVTGNFVLLSSAAARGFEVIDALKLGVFPLFVFAVCGSTFAFDRWATRDTTPQRNPPHTTSPERRLLVLELAFLGLASLLSIVVLGWAPVDPTYPWQLVVSSLLVIAMGVQNAFHRLYAAAQPATAVMTGNVTGFFVELTRAFTRGSSTPESQLQRRKYLSVTVGFLLGCLFSGILTHRFGLSAALVPTLVLGWGLARSPIPS